MPRYALIIFVKNPIEGKVKTRIAKTAGPARAVEIYRELLDYTHRVAASLSGEEYTKTVYYGDFIHQDDLWNGWNKALQPEGDLGARMKAAFREQFSAGAKRVVIIGSDCLALQPSHLENAFKYLEQHDVVLGPSTDGGYYLLGMSTLHDFLFDDMPWSQPELLKKTIKLLEAKSRSYHLLPTLTDIDEWQDYVTAKGTSSQS